MRPDSGQITAFVLVLTSTLVMMAGLVFDGGLVLSARARALGQAQEAARAGAQAIDLQAYRSRGLLVLDPVRARTAAQAYLTAANADGQVSINGQYVTVAIHHRQRTQILSAIGLTSLSVRAVGQAHPVRGITAPIP